VLSSISAYVAFLASDFSFSFVLDCPLLLGLREVGLSDNLCLSGLLEGLLDNSSAILEVYALFMFNPTESPL